MSNPWIYATGRTSSVMNQSMMIMWAINASFYAIIISATGYYILEESFHEYGVYEFGTHVFCGLVFALQCKVFFLHNNFNWLHVGAMGMSIAGTFGFIMGVSQFQNFYGEAEQLYDRDLFWLTAIFGVPVTCFLVDLFSQSIVEFLLPTNDHVIAEIYQKERGLRRDDEMQYFAERAMDGFGLFDATGDDAEQGLELSRFSESMADYLCLAPLHLHLSLINHIGNITR